MESLGSALLNAGALILSAILALASLIVAIAMMCFDRPSVAAWFFIACLACVALVGFLYWRGLHI